MPFKKNSQMAFPNSKIPQPIMEEITRSGCRGLWSLVMIFFLIWLYRCVHIVETQELTIMLCSLSVCYL